MQVWRAAEQSSTANSDTQFSATATHNEILVYLSIYDM